MILTNKNYKDKSKAIEDISRVIGDIVKEARDKNKDIVFVCIGTDKAIGDAYGPLVGTLLEDKLNELSDIYVYGTLDQPIHALNISNRIEEINKRHKIQNRFSINRSSNRDSVIIGIDACLCKKRNDIGYIRVHDKPIQPGRGIGKKIEGIGEYSIHGLVDVLKEDNSFDFNNIRLSFIKELSEITCAAIIEAIKNNSVGVGEEVSYV